MVLKRVIGLVFAGALAFSALAADIVVRLRLDSGSVGTTATAGRPLASAPLDSSKRRLGSGRRALALDSPY